MARGALVELLGAVVMRALAGVRDAGARLVTVEAGGRRAEVRVGAVRERYRVALVDGAVEMAGLAARGAGRRKRRGGLAGEVAGPARVAGHAHEAGVTRGAGGVRGSTAGVADARRRAVMLPSVKRAGGFGVQ